MQAMVKGTAFFPDLPISVKYERIEKPIEEHTHEFFEMAYVARGKTLHGLNGQSAVLSAGDFVFLSGRAFHSYGKQETQGEPSVVVNCLFLPEALSPALFGKNAMEDLKNFFQAGFSNPIGGVSDGMIFRDDNGRILRLLENMAEECAQRRDGCRPVLKAELEELLLLIFRKIQQGRVGKFYPDGEEAFAELLHELDRHYWQTVSVKGLADRLHMSEAHLCRRFKSRMGCTILEYVQSKRVEKARQLLEDTALSVPEIGYLVGYQDTKFFYQIFRRITGMSPQRYRREKTMRR